jgi:hypothetical protein
MPVTRSPKVMEEIARRISEGEPLRQICRDEHMPHWTAVHNWMDEDADFALRIAHARERGADAIAEEALEILDAEPEYVITTIGDDATEKRIDAASVQRAKNRFEGRLKLLAKWQPKRYGDKVQQEHTGTVALVQAASIDEKL